MDRLQKSGVNRSTLRGGGERNIAIYYFPPHSGRMVTKFYGTFLSADSHLQLAGTQHTLLFVHAARPDTSGANRVDSKATLGDTEGVCFSLSIRVLGCLLARSARTRAIGSRIFHALISSRGHPCTSPRAQCIILMSYKTAPVHLFVFSKLLR